MNIIHVRQTGLLTVLSSDEIGANCTKVRGIEGILKQTNACVHECHYRFFSNVPFSFILD